MLVFQKPALFLFNAWEKVAAFFIIMFLTTNGALADELRGLVASGIHKDIFLAEQSVSERVANEDKTCYAKLSFNKPNEVDALGISWTGKCEDNLAHGSGVLTLLFDTIPIFSETFDSKLGSTMIDGVPMSTLRPGDFTILQSTCKQAGIIYDNTAQMIVAEYPSFARVNSWTLEQDVWLYQNNTEAWCNGNFSLEAVVVKDGKVVALVDSVLTNLDRYFQAWTINLNEFNRRYAAGIDKYNAEIKRMAASVEQDREAARVAKTVALRKAMEGDDYVITNMADFIELMGPINGAAALAKGRKVVAGIGNISFSNGHFVSRFTAQSTNSVDARNDLLEDSSMSSLLSLALDPGMTVGKVKIACSFDASVDTDMMVGDSIVVDATLLSLEVGFISLACVPR